METAMTPSAASVTHAALAHHQDEPGALLPILHTVQDTLGYIPRESIQQIAEGLNLSRAEVHGVVTYYHHFRSEPPGRHMVQICRAEACQSRGAEKLLEHAEQMLGCHTQGGHGATSADGQFTLTPVFCLGLCASSPAVAVDGKLHGRVTSERFDDIVGRLGVTK
jgi:formate dehydrogenase subunit gamma